MSKYAWVVLFIFGALLALSGSYILFAGVDQPEFQSASGVAWGDFQTANPQAAAYLLRILRLLGAAGIGFSLFGALLALTVYRRGLRPAWIVMWLFPIVYGSFAAIFAGDGAQALAGYYGFVAVITLLALLLDYRRFFSGPGVS
jgi:hypothetical protein